MYAPYSQTPGKNAIAPMGRTPAAGRPFGDALPAV